MPELKVGKRFCKCGACKEYFNSVGAFDMHRISLRGGGRSCKPTKLMLGEGMSKNEAGYWVGDKMDKLQLERFKS